MAEAITNRIGAAIPIYQIRYDKASILTKTDDAVVPLISEIDITRAGGAIILLDWVGVADETFVYPAQDIADKFYDYTLRGHRLRFLKSSENGRFPLIVSYLTTQVSRCQKRSL